jgi:twitching motility two-component system response regulator PilG
MSQTEIVQLLREGIAAGKAGDKALARGLLRKVTDLDPRNELAWLWLAGLAELPQDTVSILRRVLEINPANERARAGIKAALLQAGIAEAKAGNPALARRYLVETTREDPGNELAWLWLASVTEAPQEALDCFKQVLAANPANERARAGILSAHLKAAAQEARAGNKERVRHHLEAVVEQDPAHEEALLWLAEIAPWPQEAIGYLEQVLKNNPHHERAREALLQHGNRLAAATPQWRCPLCEAGADQAQDPCPGCGAVLNLSDVDALLHREIQDPVPLRTAIERLEAGLRGRADFATSLALGLAYANGKQLGPAVRHLQAALRLRPGDRVLRSQVSALAQRQLEEEAAEKAREQAHQPALLVVDDSPTVRKLVTLTMERKGYRVRTAPDGPGAVESIRDQGVPDLILLDINMPGMDGYQLCKFIKQSPQAKHVPVIMLSGKDGFFDKIRGRMAGSTAYITKPFNPEALVRVVEQYCPLAAGKPH